VRSSYPGCTWARPSAQPDGKSRFRIRLFLFWFVDQKSAAVDLE
jgi:hypothetical protein